jgi:putative holliday junction resolvase
MSNQWMADPLGTFGQGFPRWRFDLAFFVGHFRPEVAPILDQFDNSRQTYNSSVSSGLPANDGRLPARILGLDVGSKTIGVAVSDPLGITAQGLETIRRKNKKADFQQLEKLIQKYEIRELVVGYPLRMSGAEGIQAEKMQRFADELRRRFQLPIHLWDERLTSAQANRLLRETDMSIKRRGEVVDRMAAVLILQSWMDARM